MKPSWHPVAAAVRQRGRSVLTESFFAKLERRPWAGRVHRRKSTTLKAGKGIHGS